MPEGALTEIWTSPPYNHCMFTARSDLDPSLEQQFAEALFGMSYDNPTHRPVLDAEGLRHWVAPHLDGYAAVARSVGATGFFTRPIAKPDRGLSVPASFSRAIENRRQPTLMLVFAIEGATHRSEGLGERKDVAGDQQVGVLRSDRMPEHAFSRDRDFGHQICARQRDALRGEASQRNAA